MKILETAILSRDRQLIAELTAPLAAKRETISGIETLRLEIEPELAIMLYDLNVDKKLPGEVIDHLKGHLSALLIVADETIGAFSEDSVFFIDELAKDLADKPTVVAIRAEPARVHKLSLTTRNKGFYLSERGRILFWHPTLAESQKQVWDTLWNTLQTTP
jgi:hypothetical protein